MESDEVTTRSRRRQSIFAVVVILLAIGTVVGLEWLAHSHPAGSGSRPTVPPSTTPPPLSSSMPGQTTTSIAGKMPSGWAVTFTPNAPDGYNYVGSTGNAVPGTRLTINALLAVPNRTDQVRAFSCQFTRTSLTVDAAVLGAAAECLKAVLPATDLHAAVSFLTTTAPGLTPPAQHSQDIDAFRITLQRQTNAFGVVVSGNSR
jgi:hypothetical protein